MGKITIYGVCISAEVPDMIIMHEALQIFPYKLVQDAMQEIKKIMHVASKDEISRDTSIDDTNLPRYLDRNVQKHMVTSPECLSEVS